MLVSMFIQPDQLEISNLRDLLARARAEDFGSGDVTTAMLPAGVRAAGKFVARERLVLCGGAFLAEMCSAYAPDISVELSGQEGQFLETGTEFAAIDGSAGGVLAVERVALNFLQRLSGIATLTRRYVEAVSGTAAEIFDTRKTTPGWRALEKYAVRCGGGRNHRMGLYDAVLVKDNHLAVLTAAGSDRPIEELAEKFDAVRESLPADTGFIEIEVDTLDQLETVLPLGADVILLDNMSSDQMRQAVERRNAAGLKDRVALEASGGISLDNVRAAAESGVERISVGALTHSARAVDIALDIAIGR